MKFLLLLLASNSSSPSTCKGCFDKLLNRCRRRSSCCHNKCAVYSLNNFFCCCCAMLSFEFWIPFSLSATQMRSVFATISINNCHIDVSSLFVRSLRGRVVCVYYCFRINTVQWIREFMTALGARHQLPHPPSGMNDSRSIAFNFEVV